MKTTGCCDARFRTTRWSAIRTAAHESHPRSAEAWEYLAAHYWYPLYAFARRWGCAPETAEDVTQSFFEALLNGTLVAGARPERGRFRNLLMESFKNQLLMVRRHDSAARRGGGKSPISVQGADAEQRYELEPRDPRCGPDQLFDRRWALHVIERALDRLEAEVASRGNSALFTQLKGFLVGDREQGTYAEVSGRVGLNAKAIKAAVHRLRQRYRALVREEVAATVSAPEQVDEELRFLMLALIN